MTTSTDKDVKFLQISDSHLFENIGQKLIGVDTAASLKAVIDIASSETGVNGILATGDISQDGSLQSYQHFSEILQKLKRPIYWLPGNHDNTDYFHHTENFPLPRRSVIDEGNWRILLLDSVIPGKDPGFLLQSELDYIDENVLDDGRHTMLVLHHQTVPCNSAWLDSMILENSSEFLQMIAKKKSIRAVLNGHIHQEREQLLDGVTYFSCPSTCFQFSPDTDDFSLDSRLPGYRRLRLKASGDIETAVIRIKNFDLNLDSDVPGY